MRTLLASAMLLGLHGLWFTDTTAQVLPDSARRVAVRALLRAQRMDSQMVAGMDLAFSQQPPDPSMPPGFVDSLRARVARSVGLFVEQLVPVYDSLFSSRDIAELTVFFESPTGRRFVAAQPALTAAAGEIGQRWGMQMAAEVMLEMSRQPQRRQ